MNFDYQTPFLRRSRAADFRAKARTALTGRWLIAIVIGILAGILGGEAVTAGSSINFNLDTEELQAIIGTPDDPSALNPQQIFATIVDTLLGKFILLAAAAGAIFSLAINLILGGPVSVGYAQFNLDLVDGKQDTGLGTLFAPFQRCFGRAVGVRALLLLISVGISVLTAVLCFVSIAVISLPGLIAAFQGERLVEFLSDPIRIASILLAALLCFVILILSAVVSTVVTYQYALCPYILAEYPTLGVVDVLRNSRTLMRGNKWRLFCLEFSFFGWLLLAVCCTCGIGVYVVAPYMSAAKAAFYDEVSQRERARGVEFPSVNPEDYFKN